MLILATNGGFMNSLQSFGAEAAKAVGAFGFFIKFLKTYLQAYAGELWLCFIWLVVSINLILLF
jgi:hypothetical protein